METTRIQNGQTERIEILALNSSGNPITGLTDVLLAIRRISDGYYLDFDDNTFKASGWTTRQQQMTEVGATNDAGMYRYDFNTTGFPDDTYELRTESVTGNNFPQTGELKVGGYEVLLANKYPEYDGGIWLYSGAGNTGTVLGIDGIASNPVSTLAAARTLADALGVEKYYLTRGSAFTIAATYEYWEFVGLGRAGILNLGNQNLDNSVFSNLSLIGTQGGSGIIKAIDCYLTTLTALRPWASRCCLAGNITILTGSMLIFDQCYSGVPGQATPILTYSPGVTNLNVRHNSGGLEVRSMTSDHTMSFEGDGQLVIHSSSDSGIISARGNLSLTNNGVNMNITKDAVFNAQENRDAMKLAPVAGSPAIGSIDEHLDGLITDMALVKGALGWNSVFEATYDENNKATLGDVYIYDSKANAQLNNKATGLLTKIEGVAIVSGLDTTKLTRTV